MAEVIRINESTCRIEDNGVRFFLLEGRDKALMIDTGRGTPDAGDIARSLTSLPVMLINTHADPDHISGNNGFEEAYMSPAEEALYRANGGKTRILPVRGGDELSLGGRTLKIIDNPGHTPGSIAILDAENRVLYGGDAVQAGNIYMFGAHRNLAAYIESLKKLTAYIPEFDVVYPSHAGFPVYPDIIEKLISGAEMIFSGKARGEHAALHGRDVLLYSFDCAGFYCPAE